MDCHPTLYTSRMILTPLQLTDATAVQQLFPHWEVVRYLDSRVPWPYPQDGGLVYVRDVALPAMAAGREWHWMIRTRAQPESSIGSISLYDQPVTTEASGSLRSIRAMATCAKPARSSTPIGSKHYCAQSCRFQKPSPTTHRARFPNMKACE